jgi:hypothetical protein
MTVPLVGWFALFMLQSAPVASASDARFEAVTVTGRAVELAAVLKELGVVCDVEPVAKQVVLRSDDGAIVPLLSDEASRALFLDARLRNRPIEIQGRRHAGLPYLQVVTFKVNDHGQWRTPEYFCEVCTISVRYPQICPCCQGAMELRMKPGAE